MDIYIEYVIIDNMAINSLLLWSTALTLRLKTRWWQIALSAAAGTVFACVLPFFTISPYLLTGIKVLIAPLLTYAAFMPISAKKMLWSTLFFAAYTFVLGGIIIAFIYAGMNMTLEKAAVYYSANMPVGIYLTGLAVFIFLIFKLNAYLKLEKKIRKSLKKVVLTIDGHSLTLDGFVDSGNALKCEELPVCFISDTKIRLLLKKEIAEKIFDGEQVLSGELLTVAGISQYRGIKKEISVNGINTEVVLALAKVTTHRYSIILNESFGEESYENN